MPIPVCTISIRVFHENSLFVYVDVWDLAQSFHLGDRDTDRTLATITSLILAPHAVDDGKAPAVSWLIKTTG